MSAGWWPVLRAAASQTRINLNISKYSKTFVALVAVFFTIALASEAQAGPGPQQIFTSVKTMKQAQNLKPGIRTSLAVRCPENIEEPRPAEEHGAAVPQPELAEALA